MSTTKSIVVICTNSLYWNFYVFTVVYGEPPLAGDRPTPHQSTVRRSVAMEWARLKPSTTYSLNMAACSEPLTAARTVLWSGVHKCNLMHDQSTVPLDVVQLKSTTTVQHSQDVSATRAHTWYHRHRQLFIGFTCHLTEQFCRDEASFDMSVSTWQ
jgi:hypothetical protein